MGGQSAPIRFDTSSVRAVGETASERMRDAGGDMVLRHWEYCNHRQRQPKAEIIPLDYTLPSCAPLQHNPSGQYAVCGVRLCLALSPTLGILPYCPSYSLHLAFAQLYHVAHSRISVVAGGFNLGGITYKRRLLPLLLPQVFVQLPPPSFFNQPWPDCLVSAPFCATNPKS